MKQDVNKSQKAFNSNNESSKDIVSTSHSIQEVLNQIQDKKKLPRIYLYFIYFIIFAVIGWILETCFSFYALGHFTKRGFLFGPLCPIYGFGALILIMFFSTYRKHNIKLFVYAAVIFSIFEYIASFMLEALFSAHWWDYTNEFMNLNGRISIFYSVAWGIIAILFINLIYPFFKKKINKLLSKIPYKIQIISIYILGAILLTDTILSSIKYLI